MSAQPQPPNLNVYNRPDVAAHYGALDYLDDCERVLFENYLKPGIAILDLGVGGGRTTPYLSMIASRYVGVDYAEEMIRICQSKFPQLEFVVGDASDLSRFDDASFDAVIFTFNGLDYLAPDLKRQQCLRECHRVLKPGGLFIFSTHNPRSIFVRWSWDHERLRALADGISSGRTLLFQPILLGLTCARVVLAFLKAGVASIPRIVRRVPTGPFWRGEGYRVDSAHGGLLTHCGVPARVVAELSRFQFHILRQLGDDYPKKSRQYVTRWYYYVFSRAENTPPMVRFEQWTG